MRPRTNCKEIIFMRIELGEKSEYGTRIIPYGKKASMKSTRYYFTSNKNNDTSAIGNTSVPLQGRIPSGKDAYGNGVPQGHHTDHREKDDRRRRIDVRVRETHGVCGIGYWLNGCAREDETGRVNPALSRATERGRFSSQPCPPHSSSRKVFFFHLLFSPLNNFLFLPFLCLISFDDALSAINEQLSRGRAFSNLSIFLVPRAWFFRLLYFEEHPRRHLQSHSSKTLLCWRILRFDGFYFGNYKKQCLCLEKNLVNILPNYNADHLTFNTCPRLLWNIYIFFLFKK